MFGGLLALVAGLADPPASLPALVRWELGLLAGLGYGLDLSCCAVSGAAHGLTWVSPRTGRAVSDAAAGEWRARLLPLPRFLLPEANEPPDAAALRDGLRLTGHFLARDAFGHSHRPLPPARHRLLDLVEGLCGEAGAP